jgi:hypothetical protein
MGTSVDLAIVNYRLAITDSNKRPIADCQLQLRLPILADTLKFADYH